MKSKLEVLNQKVSWVALLLAALILIPTAQQHRINVLKANERAASRMVARYNMENSSLRIKLQTERFMNQSLERAIMESTR